MAHRDYFKQAQKRRYQSRSYRNPHLDGHKPVAWKRIGVAVGVVSLLLVTTAFFFGHDWFEIQHVEVRGVEYIPTQELESAITVYADESALLFFTGQTVFFFPLTFSLKRLRISLPSHRFPLDCREGTIFVELEERTSNLFWKTQDRLFVVDLEGIVVREITDPEDSMLQQPNLKKLPIFVDANDVEVHVGSPVLTPEEIESAFHFLRHLRPLGLPTPISNWTAWQGSGFSS